MTSKLGKVVIVGRGKVGRALARALAPALKRDLSLVKGRGRAPLRADTIVLAIPDGALAHTAMNLAEPGAITKGKLRRAPVALHLSGLRDASVLAPLQARGVAVGAMHPLVSFADKARPPRIEGTTLVISGERAARSVAERIASLLGMHAIARTQPLQGARYHAAAAMLANGAAALAADASRVLSALEIPRRTRERALAGLLRSVADNIEQVGLPRALTGPVVRGDASAVALHLSALEEPEERDAYVAITDRILVLALEAGLERVPAGIIRGLVHPDARPRARGLVARMPKRARTP